MATFGPSADCFVITRSVCGCHVNPPVSAWRNVIRPVLTLTLLNYFQRFSSGIVASKIAEADNARYLLVVVEHNHP
jgi:hypothetical protein